MNVVKVSVLIPTYNYGHFLSETIESVLSQTFQDFELIVVDNCSTDTTEQIMGNYIKKDNRIKFIRNNENIGMYRNYNQALLLARGEYIKFLNADDKFEPTLLEKFVDILDKDLSIALVTSYRQYFGLKDDILIPPYIGKVDAVSAIFSSLKKGNWIGEPTTVMFRRKNLNLGLFDISLLMFADQDMWLRHLRVGDLYVIDEVLSYFRIHEEQGTIELNSNNEKIIFNKLQNTEYLRNAIVNNKFGYNLFSIDNVKSNSMLNYSNKEILFVIKRLHINSPWKSLYSVKNICQLLLIAIIPKSIFTIKDTFRIFRKKVRKKFRNVFKG